MPSFGGVHLQDPKIFKILTSMEHFEKNLAMTLAGYDVQPTVILYDHLMREKVKKISGTYPVDIGAKWSSQVWK